MAAATVAVVREGETIGEARTFMGWRIWSAWAVTDEGVRVYREFDSQVEAVAWISEAGSSGFWRWVNDQDLPF